MRTTPPKSSHAAPDNSLGILSWLIFLQLSLWSVIPFLTSDTLPLDVIREGLSWGQEWQAGYHKHPPLVSWAANFAYERLGDFGPYLLSQICIVVTYICTFKTARFYLPPEKAVLAVVMLTGIYYFSWPTPEFNHNVAQMPVWALIIFLFHKVILDQDQRAWLPIGGAIGLGILIKYSSLILPFLMLVYLIFRNRFFTVLRSPYPYLGIVIALLITHQHVMWLISNNFITLTYLGDRGAATSGHAAAAIAAAKFVLAQLADHLPLFIILGLCGLLKPRRWAVPQSVKPRFDLLLLCGVGPCLIAVMVALIAGISLRDMWGAPMWSLSGIMVMLLLDDALDRTKTAVLLRAFLAMFVVIVSLFAIANLFGSRVSGKPLRTDWPAATIAARFDRVWETATACPLTVVAGENWLAGLVSAKGQHRPSVWINGDSAISPWIDTQRIDASGALALWIDGDSQKQRLLDRLEAFGPVIDGGAESFIWEKNQSITPLVIRWAMIKPTACRQSMSQK